jgi:1,4-alpha-glucan branching enzyme
MLYAGQEFGEDTPKFVGPNPLQWRKLDRRDGQRLHDFTTRMTRLRTTHPALQSPNIRLHSENLPDGVMVYERLAWQAAVAVAVNFGRDRAEVSVKPRLVGTWYDAITDEKLALNEDGTLPLTLEPGQTRIAVMRAAGGGAGGIR